MTKTPIDRGGWTVLSGATGFIGRHLAQALLTKGHHLALLCRPASVHRLRPWIDALPPGTAAPQVIHADLHQPDLGVSPADRDRLRQEAVELFHLGAAYRIDLQEQEAQRTNVEGTRSVLQLAAECKGLRRFHHVSSIAVTGDFQGTFRETDFDLGQSFPHAYGRSKFESERLVRASGLPTTIYRPAAVVGDSRSGQIDKVDGPYVAFQVLHKLRRLPGSAHMPMIVPRGDDVHFHLVPVDFVVAAMVHLAGLPESLGRTYHLTDPDPPSFRQFYLATLREMGFSGPTIARPVQRLARLLMKPGLWHVSRAIGRTLGLPAEMLPHLIQQLEFSDSQATSDLRAGGIACPSIFDYLPVLIRYYEQHLA